MDAPAGGYRGTHTRGRIEMALIKCPECKADVSTVAAACPQCGYSRDRERAHNRARFKKVGLTVVLVIWGIVILGGLFRAL